MNTPKKSLLPINHSVFERSLELTSSRIDNIPTPIRDVWNPQTCPLELLPWLAWAYSIDSWKDYWPESVKRSILEKAIEVSKRKGTRQSLLDVVSSFGIEMNIDETSTTLAPFQFNVEIDINTVGAQDNEFTRDVVNELSRTKRSSSYFELQQKIKLKSEITLIGRVRVSRLIRFSAKTPGPDFPTDLGNMNHPVSTAINLGSLNTRITQTIDLGTLNND